MSEIVDKLFASCKFGKMQSFKSINKDYYTCGISGISVFRDNNKWVGKYGSSCYLTQDESEELWYKIENKPLIKSRNKLLEWLGIKEN